MQPSWDEVIAEKSEYKLLEIRVYDSLESTIVLVFQKPKGKPVEIGVASLDTPEGRTKRSPKAERLHSISYRLLLRLIQIDGGIQHGYLEQRRGVILLLAKHFLHIPHIKDPTDPFEFALCCWDIYEITKGKLIHCDYIEQHMREHLAQLDQETNLDDKQIQRLREEHKKLGGPQDGKNSELIRYLQSQGHHKKFHEEYAVKFCNDHNAFVQQEVFQLFPTTVFAPTKSAFRIGQKYVEYCRGYLQPDMQPYQRFKDLFRGSISYEAYCDNLATARSTMKVSEITYPQTGGNYRVCSVILNIDSLNFELQIVNSPARVKESHQWYELKRNSSLENLKEFIHQEIRNHEEPKASGIAKLSPSRYQTI
jgi:hypothetical protein